MHLPGRNIFTFQSGSIQMMAAAVGPAILLFFTFQSGSIQIKSLPAVVIIVSIFTFQSGSIQMSSIKLTSISSFNFTFQSGSIQILLCHLYSFLPRLYIPIWFYSNVSRYRTRDAKNDFTFQSGSIQITGDKYCAMIYKSFTFQSGSIQMGWGATQRTLSVKPLHSNLVLFKSS